jgi:hypothetical protein
MSRLFLSEGTGAMIYIFADDHCPPHVHARHRGEDWIARVGFSYITDTVVPISLAPLKNIPVQRVVNRLLDDIQARLADCRSSWWTTRRTTCLENRWVLMSAPGKIELRARRTPTAKQIADAAYTPSTERLQLNFRDGTATEMSIKT